MTRSLLAVFLVSAAARVAAAGGSPAPAPTPAPTTVAAVEPAGDAPAVGRHVPPAEATAGAAIELVADAPAGGTPPVLHYRPVGAPSWTDLELARRPDNRWVASIPATAATPPGVEYYIDLRGAPVFASAVAPHEIVVRAGEGSQRKARDLARVGGRRSRVHVGGEWIDYGSSTVDGRILDDRYYRIDADFAYRLLAYPLEDIRVGYTRLIGTTAQCAPTCTEVEAGYKVGGWFELGLGPTPGIRLDARVLVLATAEGFAVGGRGELRFGNLDGNHVALGGEYSADVGATGFFRVGWDTVPRVPMATTIEVGTLPSTDRPTGVRLVYDAFVPLAPGIRASGRVGYAARDQRVGGFTAGAGVTFDF